MYWNQNTYYNAFTDAKMNLVGEEDDGSHSLLLSICYCAVPICSPLDQEFPTSKAMKEVNPSAIFEQQHYIKDVGLQINAESPSSRSCGHHSRERIVKGTQFMHQ
jgi:hypothetical protein